MTGFVHCPRDGTLLVPARVDGRDRPQCPVCGLAEFQQVQVGANAIVERAGEVLLVRLSYGLGVGRWALPGGLVERDETCEQAAVRETKEETGFDVALGDLLTTWMRPDSPVLILVYRARILAGELQHAPEEATEARFFAADRLPSDVELAWPSTAHGLAAWQRARRTSGSR